MRLTIHVRPGAGRPGVGGEHDGARMGAVSQIEWRGQPVEWRGQP
jgi:hypothetical protein